MPEVEAPKKIVIRGPNWLGDQVLASSAFRALRAHYPDSHLTLLSPDGVSSLHFDCFNEVVSVPREALRGRKLRLLAAQLKTQKFDLSVSFPSSYSAALLPWWAGIAVRVGFAEGASGLFLTSPLLWRGRESGKHKAALYLDLVQHLAGHVQLTPTELSPSQGTGPIVIAPGASIELRVWPYYAELIQWLCSRFPSRKVVIVGAKTERDWNEKLAGISVPNLDNQIEKTSLDELIAVCRTASLVIANDSGVGHVAGTLAGAPTLVLFGPGDPAYVRPLGPRVQVLRKELPCSPCESAVCREPYGYQRCLRILTLGDVQAAVSCALK